MKIKLGILCGALAVTGSAAAISANVTIGNINAWDRQSSIGNFGVPDSSTYGQTFVVPDGHSNLIRFEFLMLCTSVGQHPFNFYIMPWDDGDQVGVSDPLYKSDSMISDDPTRWRDVVISPNVHLQSGEQYIAFISTTEADRGASWTSQVAGVDAGIYQGGSFYFQNNGETSLDWTHLSWDRSQFSQMAFSASFASSQSVPEPATILVFGTALGLVGKRKKHK